jgi:hypothetical protein
VTSSNQDLSPDGEKSRSCHHKSVDADVPITSIGVVVAIAVVVAVVTPIVVAAALKTLAEANAACTIESAARMASQIDVCFCSTSFS